jgi:hypothetical protein
MLRKTILGGAAALALPPCRPPVRQRGGAEIQAGMDGIMAGSTGRRCAFMPARSTAAACTDAWCGHRMVPRCAG